MFDMMPLDATAHILSFVDPREKPSVRLVSREFNVASTVAHRRDDQFGDLAKKVAATSSAGEKYGNSKFHPDRVEIAKLVGTNQEDRSRFNDLQIMAFMDLNDVSRHEMGAWLDHHPILKGGPGQVNPVQLAECLSHFYA